MTETTAELEIFDGSDISREIQQAAAGTAAFFSTIKGNDFATKVATIEAMTNSEPIKKNLEKTINLVNIIVQAIPMPDQRTGEIKDQPRVILLDESGKAFHAISAPLWRSIQTIIGVLPHPSEWPAPLPIHVVGIQGKSGGDFFTIKMGAAPAKK